MVSGSKKYYGSIICFNVNCADSVFYYGVVPENRSNNLFFCILDFFAYCIQLSG